MGSGDLPIELWVQVFRHCDFYTRISLGAAYPSLTALFDRPHPTFLSFIATRSGEETWTRSGEEAADDDNSDCSRGGSGSDKDSDVGSDGATMYGGTFNDRSTESRNASNSEESHHLESEEESDEDSDFESDQESECSDLGCRESFVRVPCNENRIVVGDGRHGGQSRLHNLAEVCALLRNPLFRDTLKEFFLGTTRQDREDSKYLAKAIDLVSKTPDIKLFHVTLPAARVSLDFDVSKITQMTILRPSLGGDIDHAEAYRSLHAVFQVPSLRTLYLGSLDHFMSEMPEEYQRAKTSNVEFLYLFKSNHPSRYWRDIFAYPKNLKELKIDMRNPSEDRLDGENHSYESHDILATALEPLHDTLEIFRWTFKSCNAEGMSEGAMTGFSKLWNMTIDLGVLCGGHRGLEITSHHALRNVLPRSLRVIVFPRQYIQWNDECGGYDEWVLTPQGRKLLEWLSGFAHQVDYFSSLESIEMTRDDYEDPNYDDYDLEFREQEGHFPRPHPFCYPAECDTSRKFYALFERSGIRIKFDIALR